MSEGFKGRCLLGARYCATGLLTLAVWTTWLLLVVALAFQAYIASVNEMPVPRFLLRGIEEHLAESGVSVRFGRASFDPSGRVLLQKAQFRLDSFSEPIVTAEAIYIRVDPWALLARRFEAMEIRATGANLFVPAMLSASGRPEKLVQDLDAGFSIASRGDEFRVDYLNCRLGGVCLSAQGTINAGTIEMGGAPTASLPLAVFVSRNYVALSRELSRAEEQMEGLEHATIEAVLAPSDTRGAIVSVELCADSMHLPAPAGLDADRVRFHCRVPLLGAAPIMTSAVATAERVSVGGRFEFASVRARVRGVMRMDTLSFSPKQLDLFTGASAGIGISADSVIARVDSFNGRALGLEAAARAFGVPLWVSGSVDLGGRSADLAFGGAVAPAFEDAAADWTGLPIRRFADFPGPVSAEGRVRLGPAWAFGGITARVETGPFSAYHVAFDEARATASFDGARLHVSEGYGRSGENFVRGTYFQDLQNGDYRYLLTGRLRPMDIGAWFNGDWWPAIFKHFVFPTRPPDANIDVGGRYVPHGRIFSVFGYVDCRDPVVRGTAFDTLRTRLFVNELGCIGYEVSVTRGAGSAQGDFRLDTEPLQGAWRSLDIDANAAMDPAPLAGMLPKDASAAIGLFSFSSPPSITLKGHVDGPAGRSPPHQSFAVGIRADTSLTIHGVPFEKAAFKVDVEDSEVGVADIDTVFAGGALTGSASLSGSGQNRRLAFKASLKGASLGRAAEAAEGYVVKGGSSTALDTFAKDKSDVRLDIAAEAAGRPGDLATFAGGGSLRVQGSRLGEISLLGGLSKVLKFPELRFTQAESTFKIQDSSIDFSELKVFGANSQIKAEGTYAIGKRTLDFSANIYPFMESKSLLQIFNALSAPISAVLRVRLTGSIDKPAWRLAYSPLTLMREGDDKAAAPDKGLAPSPLVTPGT
jgi:hypothetical protein